LVKTPTEALKFQGNDQKAQNSLGSSEKFRRAMRPVSGGSKSHSSKDTYLKT